MNKDLLYTYLRLHFVPNKDAACLPPTPKGNLINNYDDALKLIDATFKEVIEELVAANDNYGAFLSGGIDSSLVCSYVKEFNPKLQVFTIGSDGKTHDESSIATEFAKLMGLQQNLVRLNSALAREFLDYVDSAITEPFGDISLIPTTFVSKMAKAAGFTSCFSGDGGDELFFGYPRYWSVAKNISYQNWPLSAKKILYGLDKVFFKNRHVNSVVLLESQAEAHLGLHSRFSENQFHNLCPGVKADFPEWFDTFNYLNQKNELDLLIKMREAEFRFMGDKGLRKLKLASECTGLKILTPMLHPRFIEAALRVSPYLSYGKGKKKQLLKDLLAKRVPGAPIDNQKRGFLIPLGQWIREDLREPFTQVLMDDEMISLFGMDKPVLSDMLQSHLNGEKDNKIALFTIYTLFRWKQRQDTRHK